MGPENGAVGCRQKPNSTPTTLPPTSERRDQSAAQVAQGDAPPRWDFLRVGGSWDRPSDAPLCTSPHARHVALSRANHMSLHLKISRDACGTWSVHGLTPMPASHLPSLSASIDYARKSCNAAPATVELVVDGMYIVVRQERGWPRQLVASESSRTCPSPLELDAAAGAMACRMLNWLRGLRHSSAGGGPAAARERGTTGSATAH